MQWIVAVVVFFLVEAGLVATSRFIGVECSKGAEFDLVFGAPLALAVSLIVSPIVRLFGGGRKRPVLFRVLYWIVVSLLVPIGVILYFLVDSSCKCN